MKHEMRGTIILEQVGPCPKVYAQKYTGEISKKCKCVKDCIIKKLMIIEIL